MHDIKFIRNNPDIFENALKRRGQVQSFTKDILEFDTSARSKRNQAEEFQKDKKAADKNIGIARSKGQDVSIEFDHMKRLGEKIDKLFKDSEYWENARDNLLSIIPNIPADDVPYGAGEHGNIEVSSKSEIANKNEGTDNPLWTVGIPEKPKMDFKPKLHDDLGVALKLMDFDGAAKLSGARFVVLKGALAKMERALASFMLDIHTNEFGYTEHVPPFLVKDNAVYGTGQLPKFSEDLFKTENGFWLIPTAEVPLTNLVADTIIDADQLPIRMTAYTPCFRSEAGAAGKDTRGMIRQHQFSKVELVSITSPDKSEEEHERMTSCAEEILKRLGLHYRVMLLCTGDMGFGAQKTYDLEVWMPGQDAFREISSCSNCGAFQARRMKARSKAKGAKETEFVHTLNGSGLAIGRTMVAILENYQQADGSIAVPEALQPYMGGIKVIKAV